MTLRRQIKNPFRDFDFACSEFWFGLMLGTLLALSIQTVLTQ